MHYGNIHTWKNPLYLLILSIVWENISKQENLLVVLPAGFFKLVPLNFKTSKRKPVQSCHRQFGKTFGIVGCVAQIHPSFSWSCF